MIEETCKPLLSLKPVLVTGASTGIGRKIVEHLAASGGFVYACARNSADLQELAAIPNVKAVRLDVTNRLEIDAAVHEVAREGRGLYGLVNNAGVATLGPVVGGNESEFDLVLDVNIRGSYLVAKSFAPMIVASQGRIVMMGSISGVLADENVSAYSMSKHAIEAFADSFASEMGRVGVHVSVIEPGDFNTEIGRNAAARLGAAATPWMDRSGLRLPDDVAAAVLCALFEECPKRRYLVVSSELEAQVTIRKQLTQLVELNEGHRFTYGSNELVGMLVGMLAQSRPKTL